MTIYLLQYNNYYNRIVKKESTISDYSDYIIQTLPSANFKPNDYVNAEITLNLGGALSDNWQNGDYVIVADEYNTIVSRWFVIESRRLVGMQHRLLLRRDVVVDYYDSIIDAPTFVEKAMLDSGNPLIFNNENMTYNQIKIGQNDLFDKSRRAWLVLYVDKDVTENADKLVNFKIQTPTAVPQKSIIPASGNYRATATVRISERLTTGTAVSGPRYVTTYNTNGSYNTVSNNIYDTDSILMRQGQETTIRNNIATTIKNYDFRNYSNVTKVEDASQYDGITVVDNGQYYIVHVEQTQTEYTTQLSWSSALGVQIKNVLPTSSQVAYDQMNIIRIQYYTQTVTFTPVSNYTQECSFTIAQTTTQCKDAPYYLLYLPYSELNLDVAINIAKGLGASCYDAQILPYTPEVRTRAINLPQSENDSTIAIRSGQQIVTFVYASLYSSFTVDIDYSIPVPVDAMEFKLDNETQFIRLNSPNGSGTFEFKVTKNGGVSKFVAECTYKPITPYINVHPIFGRMYGDDFGGNDFRGLICQGDYSLPYIHDAWVEYENNNKNYLNIFNRNIESMELRNKMSLVQDIAGATIGTAQAAASGAVAGPAGAIVAGAASAIGGGIDIAINQALRNDALDLTKDQFGYQLGNIQARPSTLAKTGSITIDNHYVPYIEFFSCTDVEREALRNKIIYNGMTVNTIGKISDYIKGDYTYIKGKIIRLTNIDEDTHMLNVISEEINKGVYIK